MNTWEVEHAHRIGQEVQRLRKQLGQTAQQLADRTGELGMKMTRQAISDLENGRRRYVTTAELVVLAVALDASPVSLVYPGPYDETVDLVPVRKESELYAAQWFSALEFRTGIGRGQEPGDSMRRWRDATADLRTSRQLDDVVRARDRAILLAKLDDTDPAFVEQIAFYDRQIQALRTDLGIGDDG